MGDSANTFDNSRAQGPVLIFVVYDIIDMVSVQFTIKLSLQKQFWPQPQRYCISTHNMSEKSCKRLSEFAAKHLARLHETSKLLWSQWLLNLLH